MIEAYPLCWPQGWARQSSLTQFLKADTFKVPFEKAHKELLKQLKLLGADDIIISTNIPVRKDGEYYSKYSPVYDKGVAIYFEYKNKPMCFAADRYETISANLRAIGKTIEALRGIERWGASDMMERAFTGFVALPSASKEWWQILECSQDANRTEIQAAYRKLAQIYHPDKGGDGDKFIEITRAYNKGMKKGI